MKRQFKIWTAFFGLSAFSATLRAQNSDSLDRQLPLRTLLLQEVPVSPSKNISEAAREIRQNNLQELTDKILEYTPGINMIRRGNFAMEPSLRSLNGGQITMSINGMRIFGACTDKMDPISSYVEPNNLESFSVSYDPGANAAGSGIGGGIDFRLKQPSFSDVQQWSGRFGSGFETNGAAVQTLAGVEYSNADLAFQANGIFRRSSNYRASGGREIPFSQYRKWNGSVSMMVRSGKSGYLKADYLQDEGYDIGYPALTMDVAFAKARIAALSFVRNSRAGMVRWETKGYYNYIDHAMDDTRRPPETVPMHMDMPGTSTTFGAFSVLDLHLSDSHHMKVKVDGYHNRLWATMTMYPSDGSPMFMYTLANPVRSDLGLHISDAISLSKKLTLTPSARLEYMHDAISGSDAKEQLSGLFEGALSRNRMVANLSIAASFQPDKDWLLNAAIARGGRAASLQEAYAFYIYNRLDAFDYLGNPDLSQESSLNLSFGSTYRNSSLEISTNVFGYFIQDYIAGTILDGYSTMTIGASGVKQYINVASARLYGGEVALKWEPMNRLVVSSLNTFTRGSDNEGSALPLIAPFKTINAVDYNFRKTFFRIEGVTNAAQKHVSTQKYGETMTPESTILNLHMGKQFSLSKQTKLKINLSVENLFDEDYFQHLDIMKISRPGRNLTCRMTVLL
ncbi:iron complex outermembrane receptor protein [Arcticibacter pallidicorallinus]|uniref:Iron complex outermembrane receptor protein n=1 Tax=Arcticibacter pallidicorallinus TaxID=1259464 RepID=A0A2T0UBF5_9SPHI|nr:TonB-dependent receptor [Arcticibacter pallidicorallinus]PRY55208.1 iron complex outermembrane receptor protein [Arcticibacter pallidicorallinus]